MPRVPGLAACAVTLALVLACNGSGSPTGPTPPPPPQPPPAQTAVLLGAGDIGQCGAESGTEATAALVSRLEGTIVLAGDIAYPRGSVEDFARCFHPFWGRFNERWWAVPGNHEYETNRAQPFFDYFGSAAGDDRTGYFTFVAGDWIVLMLNSNISMARNSPQGAFARQVLEGRRTRCAMAVWHHPLFSSGPNGPQNQVRDMWALLEESGAEIVLNGHDHLYERFGPQNVDGRLTTTGLRQFTAGTGGASLYRFGATAANSQARLSQFGVLRLTLETTSYRWEFLTTSGATADSGSEACH